MSSALSLWMSYRFRGCVLQVREKEDRHQQQKIRGFLRSVEDIQADRAAAAATDMEVIHPYLLNVMCKFGARECSLKTKLSQGPSF